MNDDDKGLMYMLHRSCDYWMAKIWLGVDIQTIRKTVNSETDRI